MKNFNRDDLLFSLCGLNCALCTMKLGGHCPGCGGGAGNQSCKIARCSMERGNYEYCFECCNYPCEKYEGCTEFDSFITHRNQLFDMNKAKTIGTKAYHKELKEKSDILRILLDNFNDGRRKTLFTLAVNLLELNDIRYIMKKLDETVSDELALKEKAAVAAKLMNDTANNKGIVLKLNKAPAKK